MSAGLPTSPRASGGFTLIELLMAMLILTVGLLGLLQSIELAFQHKARNLIREEAVQIAEEQMNGLRLLKYENVTANETRTLPRRVAGGIREFTVTRRQEKRAGVDFKKLTVAVEWCFNRVTDRHEIYSVKSR